LQSFQGAMRARNSGCRWLEWRLFSSGTFEMPGGL
jgi:hypothetical protein